MGFLSDAADMVGDVVGGVVKIATSPPVIAGLGAAKVFGKRLFGPVFDVVDNGLDLVNGGFTKDYQEGDWISFGFKCAALAVGVIALGAIAIAASPLIVAGSTAAAVVGTVATVATWSSVGLGVVVGINKLAKDYAKEEDAEAEKKKAAAGNNGPQSSLTPAAEPKLTYTPLVDQKSAEASVSNSIPTADKPKALATSQVAVAKASTQAVKVQASV